MTSLLFYFPLIYNRIKLARMPNICSNFELLVASGKGGKKSETIYIR